MVFKKHKLFEQDPAGMSLDLLGYLQGSLLAKLIIVNEELRERYQRLSAGAGNLPYADATRDTLDTGAERLRRLNELLRAEADHNACARTPSASHYREDRHGRPRTAD